MRPMCPWKGFGLERIVSMREDRSVASGSRHERRTGKLRMGRSRRRHFALSRREDLREDEAAPQEKESLPIVIEGEVAEHGERGEGKRGAGGTAAPGAFQDLVPTHQGNHQTELAEPDQQIANWTELDQIPSVLRF